MKRPLLIATTNPGKLREVALFLESVRCLVIVSLAEAPPMPAVPEDEQSFRGNAVTKAIEYSRAASALALADDSGLSVDALAGAPGVQSARFGGPGLGDRERCTRLLKRLARVPAEERGATFECALALADSGRLVEVFNGSVPGRIANAPRGANGFGYDPVFFYAAAGCTFAEMDPDEKSKVSHRGRALAKLRDFLARHPEILRTAH